MEKENEFVFTDKEKLKDFVGTLEDGTVVNITVEKPKDNKRD